MRMQPERRHQGSHSTSSRPTPPPATAARGADLHVCLGCGSDLVQPLWWEETGDGRWSIELRCPECERRREGVFAQHLLDDFDERLTDGTDALLASHRRVARENLAHEVDRFVGALAAGAILPEDF
jgi:hypothetical protein